VSDMGFLPSVNGADVWHKLCGNCVCPAQTGRGRPRDTDAEGASRDKLTQTKRSGQILKSRSHAK